MAATHNGSDSPFSDDPQELPAGGPLPQPFGFSKLTPGENPNWGSAGQSAPLGAPAPIPTRKRKPLEKKFNISELVKVMYRGRWIILVTFIAVFAYTVYSTYQKPFIYASTTRMFIDRPPGSNQVAKIMGGDNGEDHSITNQMQFFKSHVVGQHVARLLHEYAQGNRYEIDSLFRDAFGSERSVPPDPRQIAIIRMQDNPKLPNHKGIPDEGALEARAASAVTIQPEGNNDYLVVSTEAYTPLDAAFIANLYVAVFVKDNQERVRSNSAALKKYLQAQKDRSFDTLRKIENSLRDYLGETNGMSAEEITRGLTTQYQEMQQKRQAIEIDLNLRKKVYADLTANLDTVQRNYYDNLTVEPYVGVLQKELTESQFEVENMQMANNLMDPRTKKYLKDEIQAKKDRIATIREKLKEVTEEFLHSQVIVAGEPDERTGQINYSTRGSSLATITALRENILGTKLKIGQDSSVLADYDRKLGELHAQTVAMPEKLIQTTQLKRAQAVAEKVYGQLEDRYLEAWMTEESVFGNVKAEDPAGLNAAPIRPNRQSSIFTGALIGLSLGIGIVVLLSFLDTTIRSPDEIESHNITLLGTIPVINHPSQPLSIDQATADTRPRFTPHRASFLDPRSSVAEAYRSLRTVIQFAEFDKEIQTIAVSSSAPQEGKSTTSSNLAIVMAQMGKKTVILDTDLRRPVLHSVFGVDREPGLTNLLFERATLEEAIKETDIPNLYVLPCGIIPPNPAELLGSKRMAKVLAMLREQFDVIILDTPPVVAVTDALILGRLADAAVLVARADVTRIDALMRAMDSIERSGTRLLGVVLNNFNVANAYGSYYKYYQYYHYYSSTPMPAKKSFVERLLPRGTGRTKSKTKV